MEHSSVQRHLPKPDRDLLDWVRDARGRFGSRKPLEWALWTLWFGARYARRIDAGEREFDEDVANWVFVYGELDATESRHAEAVQLALLTEVDDVQHSDYFRRSVQRQLFAPLAIENELSMLGIPLMLEEPPYFEAWLGAAGARSVTLLGLLDGFLDLDSGAWNSDAISALMEDLAGSYVQDLSGSGFIRWFLAATGVTAARPESGRGDSLPRMVEELVDALLAPVPQSAAGADPDVTRVVLRAEHWSSPSKPNADGPDLSPAQQLAEDLDRDVAAGGEARVLLSASVSATGRNLDALARIAGAGQGSLMQLVDFSREGVAAVVVRVAGSNGSGKRLLRDLRRDRRSDDRPLALHGGREGLKEARKVITAALARARSPRMDDIDAVIVENVRAFAFGAARLRPLTLVYGPNAAGKSSILRSLGLLAGLEATGLGQFPNPLDRQAFASLVRGNDTASGARVGLIKEHGGHDVPDHPHPLTAYVSAERITLSSGFAGHILGTPGPDGARRISPGDFADFFGLHDRIVETAVSPLRKVFRGERDEWALSGWKRFEDVRRDLLEGVQTVRAGGVPVLVPPSGGGAEASLGDGFDVIGERGERALRSAIDFLLEEAMRGIEPMLATLRQTRQVPPVRPVFDRFGRIPASGEIDRDLVALSLDARLLANVNDWLRRLRIPYVLHVDRVRTDDRALPGLVHVELEDARTGMRVGFEDVGYGISQVVPVVLAAVAARDRLLLIEQPELHIHPAVQIEVADLLIEASRPLGAEKQLIIETHSEHILLRLQRRIREGRVSPEDVKVLYVDFQPGHAQPVIHEILLDAEGDLSSEWPHGFFEERFDEVFGSD